MGKLEGKSVLITGQQGATLLVIAQQFINEGAHVFLMGSGSLELARAFQNVQTGLTCLRGDVSDLTELDRLLAEIDREIGKLDIVVANGVAEEYPTMREILVAPDETTMNLNLTGLLSAAERALPFVCDGGSIILNTALVTGGRSGADSLYVVARAAILFVAQLWSRQLEDRWIRVNAIGSGTDRPQRSGTALEAREPSTLLSRSLPSVRPNTPSQVANAVVPLLGDDICDVGGAELVVEGDTARLRLLSTDPALVKPASPDQIAQAAVYLASGDSKGITGMELFVEGGMIPL
jgi:NAD(P)-dependent dehydrogenase (short-subunit alcohol dehydrogenase family)